MKNSFSFLAKHISWKYIVLILILIYIILLTVPYLPHKTVSEEYKEKDAAAEYYSDTSGTERIAYITDNNDALLYRLGMIEEAEKSIILSTFDFNDDEAGQDILSALLNAADRGVDIRVIVDGISGFMDVQHNPWFLALDAHKNAQVRIYNPVNFLKPWDMQARLHDKYLIIDDQMYTLGGRNTTNLFLGDYSKGKTSTRSCLFTKQIRAKICKTLLCPSFRLILIPYGILLIANRAVAQETEKRRSKKQKL